MKTITTIMTIDIAELKLNKLMIKRNHLLEILNRHQTIMVIVKEIVIINLRNLIPQGIQEIAEVRTKAIIYIMQQISQKHTKMIVVKMDTSGDKD